MSVRFARMDRGPAKALFVIPAKAGISGWKVTARDTGPRPAPG